MPFYEYECLECRATFERLAKMSDPTPPCPVLVDQRDLNDEDFRVVSIKVREYLPHSTPERPGRTTSSRSSIWSRMRTASVRSRRLCPLASGLKG